MASKPYPGSGHEKGSGSLSSWLLKGSPSPAMRFGNTLCGYRRLQLASQSEGILVTFYWSYDERTSQLQGAGRGSLRVSQSPNGPHDSRINLEKDIRTGYLSHKHWDTWLPGCLSTGEHSALLWNSVAFGVLGDVTWSINKKPSNKTNPTCCLFDMLSSDS